MNTNSNTTQPSSRSSTLEAVDNALTLALMAASLSASASRINGLLATLHEEKRQPTAEEMQAAHNAYEEAHTRILSNADAIEAAGTAR